MAAEVQESTSKKQVSIVMTNGGEISGSFVGRYKFKYIGNTNYYQYFSTDNETIDSSLVENSGSSKAKKAAKAVLGNSITNSSSATLKKGGNGKIKAAYLVWQTRSSSGQNSAIALVDGNGNAKKISAKSAVVDNRRGTHSLYNMYADVTSFVTDGKGNGKYGTYTVCNIPIWDRELGKNGESMASWELVVLEEGDDYPIRACSLAMTSTFSLDDNYDAIKITTNIPLGGNLKTRADDGKAVTGQLFFGYSTSNVNASIKKTFSMKNGTESTGSISETDTAGKKVGNSCVRMSLSNFSEKKFYDATSGTFSIKCNSYTHEWGEEVYPYATFFLLGVAVDLAQPTFSGGQSTTINTDSTVNVSATGENIVKNTTDTTKQGDTGYYNGTFTVTLDSALEPVDANNITLSYYNKANKKTYTISGTYNNHVVTFAFPNGNATYFNYTNGSYLTYNIQCKVVDQNAAEYNNSHQLDGYLYSRGAKTEVWVEDLHRSSSNAKLEGYTVHYDGNGGDASNIPDMTCKRDTNYQITTEEPTRDGYTFAKLWNESPDGTGSGYISGNPFINLANVGETKTLYAMWYPGDGYIVHFDPNGGSGTMADMECDWNTSYKYPQNGFTAPVVNGEKLYFVGWAPARKSTSISKPGTTFINLAGFNSTEVTLYAIWSPYYKVIYNNYKELQSFIPYTAWDILQDERLSETLETQIQTCKYNFAGKYTALTADSFTQPKNGKVFKAWYTTEQLLDISSANAQIKNLETEISKKLKEIKELENQIENSDGNTTVNQDKQQLSILQKELLELQETWQEQKAISAQSVKINPGAEYSESILNGTREYVIEGDYVIEVAVLNAYYGVEDKSSQIIYDGNFSTYGFDITASGSETAYCMEDGTPVYMIRELSNKIAATKEIYNKKPETLKFLGWSRSKTGKVVYQPGDLLKAEHAGAKVTLYAQWERTGIAINYYGNGANSGTKASQIINFDEGTVDENGTITITTKVGKNNPTTAGFIKDGSEFITWSTDKDISWKNLCDREGNYDRNSISTAYEKKVFDPNEKITITVENGKIYLEKGNSQKDEKIEITGDLDLYAIWKPTSFTVTLHEGVGIESVDGAGTYKIGQTVTITATTKTGYHWLNWTGNPGERAEQIETITEQTFTFQMPEHNVDLTANGEANQYTIRFDPNGGTGHIDDIVTRYDEDVTLPDGAAAYKKYTLDGVNVTADVVSGVIPQEQVKKSWKPEENMEDEEEADTETAEILAGIGEEDTESGGNKTRDAKTGDAIVADKEEAEQTEFISENAEIVEEAAGTERFEADLEEISESSSEGTDEEEETESEEDIKAAHSLKAAYPSVFLGWALYDDKDKLTPTWKTGDVVRNLTAENNGVVTLYAVWDDCPWITATDLYYTLEQAQSGFITTDEILSHASAIDREDGSPILPGVNPAHNKPTVNTSFTIPDYQTSDFTQFQHSGSCTENLTVVDSVGNIYVKQITIYVVDTTPVAVKPEGYTRFIDKKYFNLPYDQGGLEDNSIWKTDTEYRGELEKALNNLENNTPIMTFEFSFEDIKAMKEFIHAHGVGNSMESGALQQFYDQFMAPCKTQ